MPDKQYVKKDGAPSSFHEHVKQAYQIFKISLKYNKI